MQIPICSFIGPVEIDTTGHSPQGINSDTRDLNHHINHTSLPNGDNNLLSAVTTTNGEALPTHLSSSSRASNNISCLEGSENILMSNQNCMPSSSHHLEDNTDQTGLIDHNNISSSQAASFLSYAQEHHGNSIGLGTNFKNDAFYLLGPNIL